MVQRWRVYLSADYEICSPAYNPRVRAHALRRRVPGEIGIIVRDKLIFRPRRGKLEIGRRDVARAGNAEHQ